MEKNLSFVEQFNKSDSVSNNATIKLLKSLSSVQQKALLKIVNSKNKELFEEMRKKGEIK